MDAQELETRDLRIRKLPGLPSGTTHGYHEYAFEITNLSPDRAHEVRLELPRGSAASSWSHGLRRLTGAVLAPPSSTVRLELLHPPLPLAGSGVDVFVDGRLLRDGLPLHTDHPVDHHLVTRMASPVPGGAPVLRTLVSQRVESAALPQDPDPGRYLRATVPVDAWSDHWLAYSGYDGVVLEAAELARAGAPVRGALVRYAEAGGSLFIVGAGDSGPIRPADGVLLPSVEEDGLSVAYVGFGVVLTSPVGVADLTPEQVARLVTSWARSREPWEVLRDPARAHSLLTVVPDVDVPVRGLFLVVVTFTVVIGPVNLVVLTRRKKRLWLLWTVPAAAIVTSAVVFLYTLFGEGLLRVERGASLTVLDERVHRAVTLGWTGYYSTLTPGGLLFDRGSEISPVLEWSYAQGASRTLDWRPGQYLASGWVRARLPSYFLRRRNELRRERLALRRAADGRPLVTNGLGTGVAELFLADADGRVYAANGPIDAGATQRLELRPEVAKGRPASLRTLYRSTFPKELVKLGHQPDRFLRPGTYLARLEDPAFLERGLRGVKEARIRAWVYGWSAEARAFGEPAAGREGEAR